MQARQLNLTKVALAMPVPLWGWVATNGMLPAGRGTHRWFQRDFR